MAGLGEAASIAGLIGLAGQCVDQVTKLVAFIKEYRHVSSNAQIVVDELGHLSTSLSQVKDLAQRAEFVVPEAPDAVERLKASLITCQDLVVSIGKKVSHLDCKSKPSRWMKMNIAGRREFFTKLRTRVTAAKQDLILHLETLDCELTLKNTSQITELATTSDTIESGLNVLTQNLGHHTGATHRSLELLDKRMRCMQRLLEHSIRNPRPSLATAGSKTRSRRHHPISRRANTLERRGLLNLNQSPSLQQHYVRVVAEAWRVYSKNGETDWRPSVREVTALEKLDKAQRQDMIKQVQNLRILLWLFKQDNFLPGTDASQQLSSAGYEIALRTGFKGKVNTRSILLRQAGVNSLWEFHSAFNDLTRNVDETPENLIDKLPWVKSIPWLQYVSIRLHLEEALGEVIFERLLGPWQNFPVPNDFEETYTKNTLSLTHLLFHITKTQNLRKHNTTPHTQRLLTILELTLGIWFKTVEVILSVSRLEHRMSISLESPRDTRLKLKLTHALSSLRRARAALRDLVSAIVAKESGRE